MIGNQLCPIINSHSKTFDQKSSMAIKLASYHIQMYIRHIRTYTSIVLSTACLGDHDMCHAIPCRGHDTVVAQISHLVRVPRLQLAKAVSFDDHHTIPDVISKWLARCFFHYFRPLYHTHLYTSEGALIFSQMSTHVSVFLKSAHALIYTPLWTTNSALSTASQPSINLPRIQLAFIVPVVPSILVHNLVNLSQHRLLIVSGPPNLPNYGAWWPFTLHHHILPIDTPYPGRLLSSSDCQTKRRLFHSSLTLPVPIKSFYRHNLHFTISYHHS